jgi:hypothetical protein
MRRLADALALLLPALWVGSMWAIGYLAVPVLFHELPDRQLAGLIAGKMFALVAYLGMGSAVYLLIYRLCLSGHAAWRRNEFRLVLLMLIPVLIGQFVIQPILADLKLMALPLDVMNSAFAAQFKTWHAVAGTIFLVQSLLGIGLILVNHKHHLHSDRWR